MSNFLWVYLFLVIPITLGFLNHGNVKNISFLFFLFSIIGVFLFRKSDIQTMRESWLILYVNYLLFSSYFISMKNSRKGNHKKSNLN